MGSCFFCLKRRSFSCTWECPRTFFRFSCFKTLTLNNRWKLKTLQQLWHALISCQPTELQFRAFFILFWRGCGVFQISGSYPKHFAHPKLLVQAVYSHTRNRFFLIIKGVLVPSLWCNPIKGVPYLSCKPIKGVPSLSFKSNQRCTFSLSCKPITGMPSLSFTRNKSVPSLYVVQTNQRCTFAITQPDQRCTFAVVQTK